MGKALSKTQKKTDNNICRALTQVCENDLKTIDGFSWVTHQANYSNFPASLIVTCVFDSDEKKETAEKNRVTIQQIIQNKLLKIGVRLVNAAIQIRFDSEESCKRADEGSWQKRLERIEGLAAKKNRRH